MRPPRIAILVLFLAASLFILFRSLTATHQNPVTAVPRRVRSSKSFFGFMYYNTPFSLFPPNAAISLTDDNSTSFAARPAAFGPKLSAKGLSGQLWVGSGFGEDSLDTDGELGCSDLPGWGSSSTRASLKNSVKIGATRVAAIQAKTPKSNSGPLGVGNQDSIAKDMSQTDVIKNDNTDHYLDKEISGSLSRRDSSVSSSSHADIQSIQEAAEIDGKVVLLKRGGCGFLEKIMWAQRRGAIAVIVGDNMKGGPLIQMFAHGEEVDNVTVPSVFTARTTAQLLSSLTQPGSFIEDSIDDNGNAVLKVQHSGSAKLESKKRNPAKRSTSSNSGQAFKSKGKRSVHDTRKTTSSSPKTARNRSWFGSTLTWSKSVRSVDSESRPPSSGRLDWVVVDDWSDEKDKLIKEGMDKSKKSNAAEDGFVIGVQDWRDPDLVGKVDDKSASGKIGSKLSEVNGPKGGSARPGSGEYHSSSRSPSGSGRDSDTDLSDADARKKGHGLLSKIFGDHDNNDATRQDSRSDPDDGDNPHNPPPNQPVQHEGLWVTITPTSSASPFFDTLLVLVISPLVTLTVVYALLILRARIRRRRWRAPKSVVDQLPVRTYHTVAASPNSSPRLPSPPSATPTTPLLQHSPPRPRPRSRTTTGVMESENLLAPSAAIPTPPQANRRTEVEKGSGGFSAEWRKYMGRQVECVVCLEEYVDGVSRVMSLPCGHEFHADCITPWLTTRRRTCPICKGDVVRSLARGTRNGPRYEPYREDSDDEGDDQAEGSGSRSVDRESDLEQGLLASEARDTPLPSNSETGGGWLGILSSSFNSSSRQQAASPSRAVRSRSPSPPPEDRSR